MAKAKKKLTERQQAGLVEKDFKQQPYDETIEAGDHIPFEALDEEGERELRAGAPIASPIQAAPPSTQNNPYVSQEEQGMEMTPKVMGPPPYGSPLPETSAGRLLPLEDHPLTAHRLPAGHPAAISEDYAQDVLGRQISGNELVGHPGEPAGTDLEADSRGERDAREGQQAADATDAARELAATENVDLTQVKGTGEGGRITKADVEQAAADRDSD